MKKSLAMISTMTVALLYAFMAVLTIVITVICGGPVSLGLGLSVLVVFIQFLINPWIMDLTMKLFYHADFQTDIPQYLQQFIDGVCNANGIHFPRIGLIDDGAPNAFTYGRTKKDARILLTRGDFELLDEEEMKSVVGHELGHIAHRDMIVMTVAGLLPTIFYAIYEYCIKAGVSKSTGSNSKNSSGNSLAVVAMAALVLYAVSETVVLWLSRVREYYADRFSGEATGRPDALAAALVKIGLGITTAPSTGKKSVGSKTTLGISDAGSSKEMALFTVPESGAVSKTNIINAMKWDLWNPWAGYYELFATHPLSSKRILALGEQAKEAGLEPYVEFHETKPKSYLDDFAKELLIALLPLVSLFAALVLFFFDSVPQIIPAVTCVIAACALLFRYVYSHPKKEFPERKIDSILGEIKVSGVTSIPCTLEGEIIGRGDPGCIFSEDFVVKDNTGMVFADYNQPLNVLNKIFAIFVNGKNSGKRVSVTGWYRRSPVPYIEILSFQIDGEEKRCYSYFWHIFWRALLVAAALAIVILSYL